MAEYTTIEGDMVDMICRRFYGDETGFVEPVLEANPGLAYHPAILPAGIVVTLPDLSVGKEMPAISLWD